MGKENRNGRAGQKLIQVWVPKSEYDSIHAFSKSVGTTHAMLLRIAVSTLIERKA